MTATRELILSKEYYCPKSLVWLNRSLALEVDTIASEVLCSAWKLLNLLSKCSNLQTIGVCWEIVNLLFGLLLDVLHRVLLIFQVYELGLQPMSICQWVCFVCVYCWQWRSACLLKKMVGSCSTSFMIYIDFTCITGLLSNMLRLVLLVFESRVKLETNVNLPSESALFMLFVYDWEPFSFLGSCSTLFMIWIDFPFRERSCFCCFVFFLPKQF